MRDSRAPAPRACEHHAPHGGDREQLSVRRTPGGALGVRDRRLRLRRRLADAVAAGARGARERAAPPPACRLRAGARAARRRMRGDRWRRRRRRAARADADGGALRRRHSTSPAHRPSAPGTRRRWRRSSRTCAAPGTCSRRFAAAASSGWPSPHPSTPTVRPSDLPLSEAAALRPPRPYEASKAAADIIARSYWTAYGLPVATTRFGNVYGGGDQNRSRLVPSAVAALLAGEPPVIRSDGSPERDFLHVDDAVDAYLALADALADGSARGEAFNAGGGEPHRVIDVVSQLCDLSGTGLSPDVRGSGTPAGEIDRQWLDSSKLRALTGWSPRIALGRRPRAHARVAPGEPRESRGLKLHLPHGRAFQVGGDQAQEGDRRRAPRQALHEAGSCDHRRGEGRRGRPRGQPGARPGDPEGQGRLDAQGQHRARDRQGHRRGRGRRELRGGRLRGLRPRRRRAADRGADRQPQPHRL